MKIGEIMPVDRDIILNKGKKNSGSNSGKQRRQTSSGRFSFSFFLR